MTRFGRHLTGIALLVVVCGCGAATTAPVLPGDGGTPPADTTASQTPPPGGTQGGNGTILGGLLGLVTRVTDLVGLGAAVENGRWRSLSPPARSRATPGSRSGSSSQSGECTMEVVPATKNSSTCSRPSPSTARLTDAQLAQSVIKEFDPTTGRWLEVRAPRSTCRTEASPRRSTTSRATRSDRRAARRVGSSLAAT
jgi:hypothetical protein